MFYCWRPGIPMMFTQGSISLGIFAGTPYGTYAVTVLRKSVSRSFFFFFLNVVFLKPKKMPMVKVSCLFSSSTFTFPNTLVHFTRERHILTRPEFTRLHFPRLYKDDVVARQRVILNVGVCEASLDQDTIWVSFNFLKCFQGVGSEIFHIYVL